MMLPRNSCSYTLPQGSNNGQGVMTGGGAQHSNTIGGNNTTSAHHGREMSFYGQYTPHNTGGIMAATNASNSVCVRRPGGGGKERAPISNMIWDLNIPHPAKSVGAIAMPGGSGQPLVGGGSSGISINSKSLTLAGPGRSGMLAGGGLAIDSHGLPLTSSGSHVPHHRYSFGVFDPSPTSNKLGKG